MSRGIQVYKTYSFRSKDPVIDQLRTLVQDSGASYAEISDSTRVSQTTLYNWFHGATRRPQSASVEAVGRALGFQREWVALAQGSALIRRAKSAKAAGPKAGKAKAKQKRGKK